MEKPIELVGGTVVGAWKVSTLLGRGGQGGVWSVKPVKTKHTPQRALKACFASEAQARARFVREVEILRRCDSPHVLKVYDQDLDWKEHVAGLPPFAYYVSEKCQGSLEQRQGELGDVRRRLVLFRHACAAVTYLHSMPDPVIHRDIKPANFLIAHELQNVVLADFGIARPLSASTLTEVFEVVGAGSENSDLTRSGNSDHSGVPSGAPGPSIAPTKSRGEVRNDRHGQKTRDPGAAPSRAQPGRDRPAGGRLAKQRSTRRG